MEAGRQVDATNYKEEISAHGDVGLLQSIAIVRGADFQAQRRACPEPNGEGISRLPEFSLWEILPLANPGLVNRL